MDSKKRRGWQWGIGSVSVILLVWGLMPLLGGICNEGVCVSAAAGVLGLIVSPWIGKKGWRSGMEIAVGIILAVAVAASGTMIGCMAAAMAKTPTDEPATVIVLGAGLHGDRPSRMLAERLKKAAVYLTAHPDAVCIVSGGQGADEVASEASVMEQELIAAGIAPERIFREEGSTDTHENIDFSLAVAQKNTLPQRWVIVTQGFHQYRAAALARRAGVSSVAAVSAPTPLHLLLCYWVRECAAICRLWLIGY